MSALAAASPLQVSQNTALKTELLRCNRIARDTTIRYFSNPGRSGQGQLIHPIGSVNDKTVPTTKFLQDTGQQFHQFFPVNTEDLTICTGRVRQRAKDVKDRPNPDFFTRSDRMLHRTVQSRSEQKTDSDFVDTV